MQTNEMTLFEFTQSKSKQVTCTANGVTGGTVSSGNVVRTGNSTTVGVR